MKNFKLKISLKKVVANLKMLGSDADRDWKIMLSLSIILVVTSVVFHTSMLLSALKLEKVLDSESESKTELINTKKLNQILESYDIRAKEFERLSNTTFSFTDPAR